MNIYLSRPVVRLDDSQDNFVLCQLDKKFKSLPYVIKNDNLDASCLGKGAPAFEFQGFWVFGSKLHITFAAALAAARQKDALIYVLNMDLKR